MLHSGDWSQSRQVDIEMDFRRDEKGIPLLAASKMDARGAEHEERAQLGVSLVSSVVVVASMIWDARVA